MINDYDVIMIMLDFFDPTVCFTDLGKLNLFMGVRF